MREPTLNPGLEEEYVAVTLLTHIKYVHSHSRTDVEDRDHHESAQVLPRKRVHCIIESDDDELPSMDGRATTEPTWQSPSGPPPPGDRGVAGARSRPKARDLDVIKRRILNTAIEYYHADLLREIPYPQPHVELQWAKNDWEMSCNYYGHDVPHDPGILKLAGSFIATNGT